MTQNSKTISGVRYLTTDFIKLATQQERLDRIKILDLTCKKNDKPIKYIENLDGLPTLNILNLNFNIIEKIQNFDKLVNLRELYMRGNKISRLEGIENLAKLKILDVSDNNISVLPFWFTRRCKYIKILNISNNAFDSMEEISKLGPLKDLSDLNAAENPVTTLSHYRSCTIMRLKFLQILDKKNITNLERNDAIERFKEDDFDKLTSRLVEKEKEFEEMKEKQEKLNEENFRQADYQKDLNKKQKDYLGRIKTLEEELKNKDSLLKKKSEDLFKTCQKYYELEQDIAFIKIDAKFDILNHNLGALDAPDDISEHSFTGTGDQAYMGKGQFITLREAHMLHQRRQARQPENHSPNVQLQNGGRDSVQEIKTQLLDSLNERIREKIAELDNVNKSIIQQSSNPEEINTQEKRNESSPTRKTNFVEIERSRLKLPILSRFSPLRRSLDHIKKKEGAINSPANISEQFLEKIENLTDMQREADDLRQQMEVTERITSKQKEDVEYLRQEYEKMKLADPKLAHDIETEMHDKKCEVDQNYKLYEALSKRLDQLSLAIEKSMRDIKEMEEQLIEENQIFTEKMKTDIDTALHRLSNSTNTIGDQKKWIDAYREAEKRKEDLERNSIVQEEKIEQLKSQLISLEKENSYKSMTSNRPVEGEVLILRQDLDRLKEDALGAKEDLESEIEMEKCRNDELQKRIEEMQCNEYELQEQLELVSDRYRQILDKVNTDQVNLQTSFNQSIATLNDEVIQKIKEATSNSAIINEPMDSIDEAICELVKSIEHNKTPSPAFEKIVEDNSRKKSNLELSDKNIKIDKKFKTKPNNEHISRTTPNGTNKKIKRKNEKRSMQEKIKRKNEKRSMQEKLAETSQEYQDEMLEITSQVDKVSDIIEYIKEQRKEKKRSKKARPSMSFNLRRSEVTSEEELTSESYTPRFKSRSFSQDRISKRKPKNSFSDFRKWKSVQQDVSIDDELLDEIENELSDLKQQISSAGSRSTQKFEDAMTYISELEMELQRKDEEMASRNRRYSNDQERNNRDEDLQKTMLQVAQCEEHIRNLHKKLNIKDTNFDNDLDNNKIRSVLQAQKTEIERLNAMLEKLTAPGNPSIIYSSTPQFPQTTPTPVVDNNPSQIFLGQHQGTFNSQSSPLLHAGRFLATNGNIPNGLNSRLFCNVPEHHHMEDYLNVRSSRYSSLKMKNKIKSNSLKYLDTLEMLKEDLNKRNEELDDVEIQVSKQTGEIERLNYQINQLNLTKQDLIHQLSSLRQETDLVTRETISSTSDTLNQMRAKKVQLNEEISKLDTSFNSRREELAHLEGELHTSRNQLSQVQIDTTETVRRYEEARRSHRQLILECEQLEKRSNEASLELANGIHDLNQVKTEISSLVSNRSNLEGIISKTQEIINQKDQEYKKITEDVNKETKRLNNLQSELTMMNEKHLEKIRMISDGDQLLIQTRMELNHLKKEIEINQQYLERMESDLGEKSVAIELAKSEFERLRQINQQSILDYQSEQMRLKRDVSELKSLVNESQCERNSLLNGLEDLKMKSAQMKENIERQEQILHGHQSEVDRCSWKMEHSDNMLKMKQGQLQQLSIEYNERLLNVERLHAEIHQQEIESKRIDSDIKRKSAEVEKIRQSTALEHENQLRLQFDKDNLETSVATLTKERNMLQNQIKEVETELKNIKKQESQSQESLLSLESRLSQLRSEYEKMCSNKHKETIKRDELKLQTNNMTKQLHESKCELQSMRERLTMMDGQCDERTTELRKKMQLQNNLNIDIRKLQDQIRMANMSFEEANNQEHNKKDRLSGLDLELSRKEDELKNLERKKEDLQNEILKRECKLEKVMKSSSSELNQLKSELTEKMENLEATGSRLQQIRKEVAIKEFTEQKICELEQIIRQHEMTIDNYEKDNRRKSNHISVLSRDIASQKENHQFEMENKDKELGKLRKRVAREIFQLEKLAEDQCQRANSLAEDLNQARRDYMLLRNRSLAQEHFLEQQNLLKQYMQPTISKMDLPQTMESSMLTENCRNLQNRFNLLRDNIASASHTSIDGLENCNQENSLLFNKNSIGERKWYTTSSSGLGSTMEHNPSDTSPENERVKKALHNQFDEEIETMYTENDKSHNMCRQLRNEVDHLKSTLPVDKSTSVSTE